MLGFLRRQGTSRSALGAAVTGIPSAPARVAVPLPVAAAAEPTPAPPRSPAPAAVRPAAVPVQAPPPTSPPRVELGFRDGTSTVLEPQSAQAQALLDIADLLSGRGAPSGSSTDAFLPTFPE